MEKIYKSYFPCQKDFFFFFNSSVIRQTLLSYMAAQDNEFGYVFWALSSGFVSLIHLLSAFRATG